MKETCTTPKQLRLSRSNLLYTDPESAVAEKQPVEVRLYEKKFIHMSSHFLLNNTEPRLNGKIQHNNLLGRGTRIGLDANLGQPVQGATVYATERGLLRTGADLTVSVEVSEEWGNTQLQADPVDVRQLDLLTQNDSVLRDILLNAGQPAAEDFVSSSLYTFRSIERVWTVNSTLARYWGRGTLTNYRMDFSIFWTRSTTRAIDDVDYRTPATLQEALPAEDYALGVIPLDDPWREILVEGSRAINFTLGLDRDTRDSQIAPTRGTFARLSSLYAFQLGGQETQVFDAEMEGRYYRPFGNYLVWAQALRLVYVASLREDRSLPRAYWKVFGGDGTVRGVERNRILDADGGRVGMNLRSELRFKYRDLGLVAFWDRANVWHRTGDADPFEMIDGFGTGLRYIMGIPFRIDFAFNDGFDKSRDYWFYFSVGQAF